jgi:hypothetical protein
MSQAASKQQQQERSWTKMGRNKAGGRQDEDEQPASMMSTVSNLDVQADAPAGCSTGHKAGQQALQD